MTAATDNGDESDGSVPRHVAIIMDGNGRWAKARGKPRHYGHRAGVASVRAVVEESVRQGVEVLTLFAFSSENWRRPRKEVDLLMDLFLTALNREVKKLHNNRVRLRIIGDISAFSDKLQKRIAEAERLTAANDGLVLQVAANYGGRWDITQAMRRLASQVAAGQLQAGQIDEDAISTALSFADLPDPELFIRTGGEHRISNFMLWQCAYTELYFTDVYWPDFRQPQYLEALADFARRQRRFGMTGEQVSGGDD